MKKHLLLLVGLTIIACGKEDDNSNDSSDAETFLQRFDGMGFAGSETGDDDFYVYFHDANTFVKFADIVDGDTFCIPLNEGSNVLSVDNIETNISIITNDNNVLFFEATYIEDGITIRDTYRFTSNSTGDQITLMYDENPNDIEVYTRTNITYSSFVTKET